MTKGPATVTFPGMEYRGFKLYPFQEQAIRAIEADHSVIVSAPTGAGKTIIAEYAIEQALERGRRIVYTSPIKALSNQKYRDFRDVHGDKVGIMTGDVTINGSAPILIMTTEIFRNTIFEDADRLHDVAFCIFDEVHYLGDSDRGSVWEESIIFAPDNIRFIALSATIGNLDEFRDWMASVREGEIDLVHTDERPVPLHRFLFLRDAGIFDPRDAKDYLRRFGKSRGNRSRSGPSRGGRSGRDRGRDRRQQGRREPNERKHKNLLSILVKERKLPVLYFAFSRRKCEQLARRHQRRHELLTADERRDVVRQFQDLVIRYDIEDHPAVPDLMRAVSRGVLYHHAGMLPMFKEIVERLFGSGLVKLLFTTETFALGVNMPAKCVVFDSLSKYNGVEMVHITPLGYQQMAGRAGRQGIDDEGEVYAILDPELDSAKAVQSILFKRADGIRSQFGLGYSTILNLLKMLGDDVDTAVEKSFASFQQKSSRKPLENLHRKLAILADRRYRDGNELTGKGSFCARINGFEIPLTELFWDGCFEDLDALSLAALANAISYTPRARDVTTPPRFNPVPHAIQNRARKRLREFRKSEWGHDAPNPVDELDYSLTTALVAWCEGMPFADVARLVTIQEGDLVRALRLTVQVVRQLAWALPSDHHVAATCRASIQLLDRDEVDAEKQLQAD